MWHLHKLWTTQHIIYPHRVLIWFISDIAYLIVFPFLWLSVYDKQEVIGQYTKADIVTYYIIIAFISLMATSHIMRYIQMDIIKGTLNQHLTRPLSYILFRTIQEYTYRFILLPFTGVIIIIAYVVFKNYALIPHSFFNIAAFIISILIAFLISHCFEIIIGLSTFWLGQTSALNQTITIVSSLLSGMVAPLFFFPQFLQTAARYSPFQYLAYFPTQIYLGKISSQEIMYEFSLAALWLAVLSGIIFIQWRRLTKNYDGAGI